MLPSWELPSGKRSHSDCWNITIFDRKHIFIQGPFSSLLWLCLPECMRKLFVFLLGSSHGPPPIPNTKNKQHPNFCGTNEGHWLEMFIKLTKNTRTMGPTSSLLLRHFSKFQAFKCSMFIFWNTAVVRNFKYLIGAK